MGGEYRPEVCPVDEIANLSGGDASVEEAGDRFAEVVAGPGTADIEVLDTMLLLGNVGQVEVDGESPDQMNGPVAVETGQQVGKFGGDSGRSACLAEFLGEMSHLFDGVEKVLAVLAGKGITQLVTQPPDVGA